MAMPPGIIEELDLLSPMLTNEFSIMQLLYALIRLNFTTGGQLYGGHGRANPFSPW